MSKEKFINAKESVNCVYSLKDQLEKKLSSGEVFSDSHKKELSAIKRESLKTLSDLLTFCATESSNPENTQASIVIDIKNKLSNILDNKNIDSFSYSTFKLLEPTLIDLFNYISTKQSNSSDQLKSRSVAISDVRLDKVEDLFKDNKPVATPIVQDIQPKDNLVSNISSPKTIKSDYHRRLIVDRGNLLELLGIPENITKRNYEDIFEEYKEKIFSHKKRQEIEMFVNGRAGVYKSHLTRTEKVYWMGEVMIFLQGFFAKKDEKEDGFASYKREETKKKNEQQELLRSQSVHFPEIIRLLEQFKKTFENEYFSKSSQEIKEAFVKQYTALVLDSVIKINPELLSLSGLESRVLQSTHRKKELYEGIPFIISSATKERIEKGISKGFIFGEINDLIKLMKKIYKENKIA